MNLNSFDWVDEMVDRHTRYLEDQKYCEEAGMTLTDIYEQSDDEIASILEDLQMGE